MGKASAFELYNLTEDIGESNNLYPKMEDKGRTMYLKFQKWQDEVGAQMPSPHPDWKG